MEKVLLPAANGHKYCLTLPQKKGYTSKLVRLPYLKLIRAFRRTASLSLTHPIGEARLTNPKKQSSPVYLQQACLHQ